MFKIKNGGSCKALCSPGILLAVILFAGSGCAGNSQSRQGQEPAWVSDPYKVYNRAASVAVVGYGPSRDTAEKAALGNLTAIFGQSVTSESKTSYTYSQALEASRSAWQEKSDIAQAVKTSAAMDTLIGAEIKDVWKSPDGTWYAVAALDKAKTNLIYSEMIQQNLETIAALTKLTEAEKQSIDGFIGCSQAAILADANLVFANVQNVISPGFLMGENFKTGNDYRLEAARIARNIPIAVTVDNDRQDRIKSAFSGVLSRAGFRTGGTGSRYALKAVLSLEEISYANNPYRWIRYVVNAELTDTSTGTSLFPYSINGREGHPSLSEAETRAVRQAEQKITAEYIDALSLFLLQSGKK